MNRREFIATSAAAALGAQSDIESKAAKGPLNLLPGPHLFLDDYLVAECTGVERQVAQPRRVLTEPVVTSKQYHQNWQPWYTVLRDPESKRFRMWYTADVVDDPADGAWASKLAYLESRDGIHWPGPYRRPEKVEHILFGACVLDDGAGHAPASERFKLLYHAHGKQSGPAVAFSPDGLTWTMHAGGKPVLPNTGDSWHAGFDPIRKRYFLIGKLWDWHTWTNAEGKKIKKPIRRYGISFSPDFRKWSKLKLVFSPDEKDPGITEWYGATGFQARGDLLVGFLQVLRDDLTAEGAPAEAIRKNEGNAGAGMGYTVLTWSRDGVTWRRDRHTDKFFEPDPRVGSWDHAMSWVSTAVPVGDEVYLYYAGYRWGHKHHRSVDRQIGLVKLPRDRYVARRAGAKGGTLRTPLVRLAGKTMTLNADATRGEVRVQLLDEAGKPIPGYALADCRPIREDALAAGVRWAKPLAELGERPLRVEIAVKSAALYALALES